jgi:hypothetical protein
MAQKGHPNYFKGKKVDRDLFYDLLNKFLSAETTLENAAKTLGLSRPTLSKRYQIVLEGEKVPDYWFFD